MAGAFGNPLSAGIALQMDTNKIFNDERQLRLAEKKLDMGQEAARASQRKADEKELAGILGKITSDDSKIWWRYQDDAKHSYANTIRDVSNAWKAGDYNSAYTKLNEHNVKMTGLQQATKLKDDWITRSMKGDVYFDDEFLKALEDRNKTIEDVAALGAKTGYGIYNDASGTMGFAPLTQVHDSIENMKSIYDSVEGQYVMDENNQLKQMGTDPMTGAVIYEKRSLSPEQAYQMWNSGFANDAQRVGELRKTGVDIYSLETPQDFSQKWQEYGMNLARTMGAGKQEFTKIDDDDKFTMYAGGAKTKQVTINASDDVTYNAGEIPTVQYGEGGLKLTNVYDFTWNKSPKGDFKIPSEGVFEVDAGSNRLVPVTDILGKTVPAYPIRVGYDEITKQNKYTLLTPEKGKEKELLAVIREALTGDVATLNASTLEKAKGYSRELIVPSTSQIENTTFSLAGIPKDKRGDFISVKSTTPTSDGKSFNSLSKEEQTKLFVESGATSPQEFTNWLKSNGYTN
jgi:hypothetical protein